LAYSLGQEGLVVIKLKLNKDGEILDLSLLEECRFKILNEASLDTISAIHRFPPIPNEIGLSELTLRIPIEYKIKM
jgi:TonB family protein